MENQQTGSASRLKLSRDAFSGQVAVVTGAGRGIGREIALAFAHFGARVAVAELADTGQETADEINQRGGGGFFIQTDVSSEESVASLVERVHQQWGPVDILVNNAILCPVAAVTEMEPALWDQVMAVNLRGTFLTCRACLPDMLARGSGTILNLTSTDAMPGLSAYIATKQGINGFTQSLAAEVGEKGIRVIAFGPGMVDTPGIRAVALGLAPRLGLTTDQFLSIPLHNAYEGLMPAEDAGAAAVFLAAMLAEEFHGEIVNGYTVLERAGMIPGGGHENHEPAAAKGGQADQTAGPDGIENMIQLCHKLEEMIAETGDEFNRLPVFVRPMARSGFKGKAGQSLQDWSRTAFELTRLISDPGTRAEGFARAALIRTLLQQLCGYYEGVPAETARFTKDPDMLRQVRELSRIRIEQIQALIRELE